MSGQAGFSLVEMLVVLLLIGFGLTLVAPGLPSTDSAGSEVVGDLVRFLRSARQAAVVRGHRVSVRIEPREGRVRMSREGDADTRAVLRTKSLSGLRIPERAGPVVFRFGPLGRAEGAVVTVGAGNRMREIRVDRWTGAVSHRPVR